VIWTNEVWLPKWIRIAEFEDLNFFVMMNHTVAYPAVMGEHLAGAPSRDDGVWTAWVWVLGDQEQATRYYYDVLVFKGGSKTGGTFTTQSIRSPVEQIIATKSCLHFTDKVAKHISKWDGQMLSDFFIDVSIHKKPALEGTNTELSHTGPYHVPAIATPPKADADKPPESRFRFPKIAIPNILKFF